MPMVISRTPLRISFVGGGSDLPTFYREHGGAVVSTAINKYVYVTVNKKFDDGVRVAYSQNEEVASSAEVKHPLVKATLDFLNIKGGVEITSIADIPSRGTGLGSSSSFTVGLINALSAYVGKYVSAEGLSESSCRIEIDICGEPIGKQDQYAAAYGGFNFIEFAKNGMTTVCPIICQPETIETIRKNTLMFFTGVTRNASHILKRQSEEVGAHSQKQDVLLQMVKLARDLRDELQKNITHSFGEILHENWLLKKSLTEGISNSDIDGYYALARAAGAAGGKLLGAGGGGFLMIYASEDKHPAIKQALHMLRPIDVGFEPLGSRIVFYH